MKRFLRVSMMAVVSLAFGGSESAASELDLERTELRIRIYDYAGLPDSLLGLAEERAAGILREAGIETEWAQCRTSMDDPRTGDPICRVPLGPTDLVVRILTEKMAKKMGRRDECVGYAIHTESGRGDKAGLYFHRVQELERQTNAPRHAILGIFMAHEIGHLLLPDHGHSRDGVMRAWWGPETMLKAAYGRVEFNRKQARQIGRNVEERTRAGATEPGVTAMPPRTVARVPGRTPR